MSILFSLMAATSDDEHAGHREALLKNLDDVYTLARAVSRDADDAVRLVEATYTQAFVTAPLSRDVQDDKRWLLALLMQVHREQTDPTIRPSEAIVEAPPADAFLPLRRRLAEQMAARALPPVLATLPEELRLLLLLCEAQDLSCNEAAAVLGLDTDTACRRREEALAALHAALREDASPREQQLLDTSLPPDGLKTALRRVITAELGPLPPTLRPTVLALLQTPPPLPPLPTPLQASAPTSAPPDEVAPHDDIQPRDDTGTEASEPREADRTETPHRRSEPRWRAPLVAVLVVLTVGLLGYAVSRVLEREPETNLITLAAQDARAVEATFRTGSPEQAEEYVRGRLGWRLTLPTIDRAALTGVGIHEPTPGVMVPVFLYEDEADDARPSITLYVYNYALLDRYEDRIWLAPDIKRQIQEDQRFDLYDLGEKSQVLIWRNRDDIYVAVTSGDAKALRQRILFPS